MAEALQINESFVAAQRAASAQIARLLKEADSGRFVGVRELEAVDRIALIRHGIPASVLPLLAHAMGVRREQVFAWAGIPRATAQRKVQASALLAQDESERALGLVQLIAQVEQVVQESGAASQFDAAGWTAGWLGASNAALGGRQPGDFMDTAEGRQLVSQLIAQMQSGAYA